MRTHHSALLSLLTSDQLANVPLQRSFRAPKLSDSGARSLFGQIADQAQVLTRTLGGRTASNQKLLAIATLVVQQYRHSRRQWFGIYQTRHSSAGARVRVTLAYFGAESRAEFSPTQAFVRGSNDSAVGLSGHGHSSKDVAAYVAEGGGHHTCDAAWPEATGRPFPVVRSFERAR